jgi:hypothetical protein
MPKFASFLWQRPWAALTGRRLEDLTDVKVLIQEAVEDQQQAHHLLVQAAVGVIQNSRTIELRLSRRMSEVERLRETVREVGERIEEARGAGDVARVAKLREDVRSLADQLMSAEHARDELRIMLDDANANSAEARREVEQHAARMQQVLADRARFLSQLEQTNIQHAIRADSRSPAGPENRGAGEVTTSRTVLQRRYAAALRLAGERTPESTGPVATPRLEELRAARAPAAGGRPPEAVGTYWGQRVRSSRPE